MLNGIDPIIVFTFYNKAITDAFSFLPLPPSLAALVGVPVPIYLSERLTGIYIESETRGIDIQTRVDSSNEKNPVTSQTQNPVVTQLALDSTVQVSMLASRDSLFINALISLCELALSRLATAEYGITYLNGPTAIFGGLLNRFQTNVNRNDDLVRIDLVLSNAKKEPPTPGEDPPVEPPAPGGPSSVPNTAGTTLGGS